MIDGLFTWLPVLLLAIIWQSISQQLAKQRIQQQQLTKEIKRIQIHLGMPGVDADEVKLQHQVKHLLQEDQMVEAVKLVRNQLGYSLLEAKQYVDSLHFDSSN